jgi:hypothetical protein
MRLLISGGTDKEDVELLTIILARQFVGFRYTRQAALLGIALYWKLVRTCGKTPIGVVNYLPKAPRTSTTGSPAKIEVQTIEVH